MKRYPKEWERHETLRDGARVFVRPLKPEDRDLYPDFLSEVTPEDLRLRFFAAMRELDPELISKLVNLDYENAMAFVAIEEETGKLLGVVRLHFQNHERGEYAVIVRSRLKGHGLGWLLMQRIIEYARAKKLKQIHGQVLSENTTMLAMCVELGFHVADDREASGIKIVTLDLEPA